MTKTWIFLLILGLSYGYGIPCSTEDYGDPGDLRKKAESAIIAGKWAMKEAIKSHYSHARKRAEQARDAATDAERAAIHCDWRKFWKAWKEAERRLASARKYRDKAEAKKKEWASEIGDRFFEFSGTEQAINKLIDSTNEALSRAIGAMALCKKSLWESIWDGLLDLTVTGVGTTTGLSIAMTNKTNTAMEVVIPTGTQLTTEAKGFQPYQTGYNPPIALGPRETVTKEIVAFCTDNSLAPAPKDDPSVTYTVSEGPPTPQQEKITELIVTTNSLRQFYADTGPVAEPDDFLKLPSPLELPPEPEVYGPPPPPKPRTPEEEAWRELQKKELDEWVKKERKKFVYGPRPLPPEKPEEEEFVPPPSEKPEPEFYGLPLKTLEAVLRLPWWYGIYGGGPPPEPAPPIPEPPPEPPELPPGTIVLPPDIIILSQTGPLEFPGTTQFTLAEVPELKTNISSRKEKGEAVFSNPTGKVEVSLEPTEDPEIVKFNITELEARSPSFEALGKSRGDINIALNSPEKSTGLLNIETGEVRGTVSVKAWGKEYKEPFPAAATYTGKFDVPTRKLSLNLSGTSFEPVEIPQGPYEKANPEKFWETVHLYSVWGETNNIGKEELTNLMTEQFLADYPEKKAKKLANMVAGEIMDKVKQVQEIQEELKEEDFDFSRLDPTLKWRETES